MAYIIILALVAAIVAFVYFVSKQEGGKATVAAGLAGIGAYLAGAWEWLLGFITGF